MRLGETKLRCQDFGMTTVKANSKRPLRVGLLLDSLTQPTWVFKIINDIHSSSFAEICLVVKNEAPIDQAQGRLRNYWKNRKYLLYALYNGSIRAPNWVKQTRLN